MNRSERTYHQLFELLGDTPARASLTPEEIQSLITGPSAGTLPDAAPAPSMITARRVAVVVAVLAVSAMGIWLLPDSAGKPGPATPVTLTQKSAGPSPEQKPEQKAAMIPQQVQTPEHGTAAMNEKNGAGSTRETAVTARRATRQSRPKVTMPVISSTVENDGVDNSVKAASATNPASIKSQSITTLPMLELGRDELKALGVSFINGEVQTIGEEYYTLVTEQDRILFAQMGMDTTRRMGIVQMRLSIDTFGLTTKKYSWANVESYSRIAPIIALNSYVKDEHNHTVSLNSFNRSPIMDSAKRSISYMVNMLAKALENDCVEHIIHDSDRANPARILVPVHIRLGDEPISGSTKRRGADVILWYYPTPEFVDALPARYRVSLQKELNAIADVVECNLPPGEVCRQMTGELSFLNYCKRMSGALHGLNVTPNSGQRTITVRYTLENPRQITASLYGIRGEYIRELMPEGTVGAGTHSTTIRLGSVPSGAYMVLLKSEQDEQVSERLIVQ